MSSDALLHCPFCMGYLGEPVLAETGHWEGKCTRCSRQALVEVYPSIVQQTNVGKTGEPVVDDSQSACMKHPGKQAVEACSQCGRFMCETCRIDFGGTALCPECAERALKGSLKTANYVQMLKRGDLAVRGMFLLPLYFGMFCGVFLWLVDDPLVPVGEDLFFELAAVFLMTATPLAMFMYPFALYQRFRKGRVRPEDVPSAGLTPVPVAVRPWLGVLRPIEALLGFGKAPSLETCYLYWADEYLLVVRKSGTNERYQRIYYKDIRGVRVQGTGDYLVGLALLVAALSALSWDTLYSTLRFPDESPALTVFIAALYAWFAWVLYFNWRGGRSCRVDLYTPVSQVRLESVGRWNAARAFLGELSQRVARHQGAWQPDPAVELRMLNFRHKPAPKRRWA